ncbi:hypothetical protein OBBRIDRAFT_825183 [Obba rivulosa]|uniref:Zn(2)-C6 fungal-type domain-containing protein n=1 Tax=Obba rivulosa TaxID=1052685 RepID=A0A8E2B4Q6_9APHY|nr:hypothetical protein OBBRIDRAFT_825183 [Obba rivulosa]
MAESRAPTTTPGPSTLQRGKACLRCRKRKMRCDGMKPACQQCVRAKKPEGCEYDDGKGKTRTQLMREHIARLELRIKQLEHPEQSSPAITLFDPHAPSPYYSESSSSSSHGSPGIASVPPSASPSPFQIGEHDFRQNASSPLDVKFSEIEYSPWGSLTDFTQPPQVDDTYIAPEELPLELAQMLLEIFLPHAHQVGLVVHVPRLRDSLHGMSSERRHPALMNAIYLWACYLSRPGQLSEHEPLYLSRALAAMTDAIQFPSRIVDMIQASCLLSMYLLTSGRIFEGSYYATVAASLAIQCGLHQVTPDEFAPPADTPDWGWGSSPKLEPAKDAIERGERILTFWQVYNLDRCWSAVLHRPALISDSEHPWSCIYTPWPQRMEEYEIGEVDSGTGSPTLRTFFSQSSPTSNVPSGFSTMALRAKASALFEGASRLSSGWNRRQPVTTRFTDNLRGFEQTLSRFTTTLLPLHQLGAAMPEDKFTLITVHSLVHAAMINLHTPFTEEVPASREKCGRAARALVMIIKHITDIDYEFLDPLIGACWTSASKVLQLEVARMQAGWPPLNGADVHGDLAAILYAMTKLSARFPLIARALTPADQASKPQNCKASSTATS